MRQDCELACDAASLRHLDANGRRAYGYTLLQLSETLPRKPIPANALGIVESAAHLRERILMLASRSGRFQSTVATLLFLPLAAVAFSQPAPATAVQPVEAAAPIEVVASPAVEDPQVTLEITIDAQGQYFINLGEEPAENPPPVPVEQIGEQVAKIMSANPEVPVFVRADATIEYGIVIKLISTLQEAGVTEPRLLTQPPGLEL
jgi:biopolymer transport protein TolR